MVKFDRKAVEVLAVFISFEGFLTLYRVWHLVWLSGGEATIYIDRYGEQFAEFILLNISAAVVAVGLHSYIRGGEAQPKVPELQRHERMKRGRCNPSDGPLPSHAALDSSSRVL